MRLQGKERYQQQEKEGSTERSHPSGVADLRNSVKTSNLDLDGMVLEPVFEADFIRPLRLIYEEQLFEGEKRVKTPDGFEWVQEGSGRATASEGWLTLEAERDPMIKASG